MNRIGACLDRHMSVDNVTGLLVQTELLQDIFDDLDLIHQLVVRVLLLDPGLLGRQIDTFESRHLLLAEQR